MAQTPQKQNPIDNQMTNTINKREMKIPHVNIKNLQAKARSMEKSTAIPINQPIKPKIQKPISMPGMHPTPQNKHPTKPPQIHPQSPKIKQQMMPHGNIA